MKSIVLLEKGGKWSLVPCRVNGSLLETGDRNFRFSSEAEALGAMPEDYEEMRHDLMPIIFGDSYRRVFVSKHDMMG